jgi:hypothetical protein
VSGPIGRRGGAVRTSTKAPIGADRSANSRGIRSKRHIASITYRFDESAYPRDSWEYVKTNREERFKVKELANGTSIVRVEVKSINSERAAATKPIHRSSPRGAENLRQ